MWCDSHVHVVGPLDVAPQVPERTYLAGEAPLATLRARGAERGITRFVIVQPSFYGTDNSVLLGALADLAGAGRGVAVIDPEATPRAELERLHAAGVRGLRLNLYSPLTGQPQRPLKEQFAATTRIAADMGWHVQVIAPLPGLLAEADCLLHAPVDVVIDHYGLYGTTRPTDPAGRDLLDLARRRHVWVKLSAPYRHDRGPFNIEADRDWVAAFLALAPDRCVWGSDWPHPPAHDTHRGADTPSPYRPLSYAGLLDSFIAAAGADDLADAVLGANPNRLYGF